MATKYDSDYHYNMITTHDIITSTKRIVGIISVSISISISISVSSSSRSMVVVVVLLLLLLASTLLYVLSFTAYMRHACTPATQGSKAIRGSMLTNFAYHYY